MRKIYCLVWINFFLLFFIHNVYSIDFNTYVEPREGFFTVGKLSPFIIYVENTGIISKENYTITYQKEYTHQPEGDLSHLIQIHLASDKIENLEPNQIRETQGTIILLGEIKEPGGTVTFTVESDGGEQSQTTLSVTGSLPIALPEFTLIGLIQLTLLGLIVFYSFHIH